MTNRLDRPIKTQRLIIRNWQLNDLDDFYEYASVPGVGETAGWPHHNNKDVSLYILKKFIKEGNTYPLVYKENNKVIGSIGLHDSDQKILKYKMNNQKEIGYVLSKDYWGKGLMTEAVKACIVYAFETLNLELLTCEHFNTNKRSKRIIDKTHFTYIQTTDYTDDSNNHFKVLHYVLKKETYQKNRVDFK